MHNVPRARSSDGVYADLNDLRELSKRAASMPPTAAPATPIASAELPAPPPLPSPPSLSPSPSPSVPLMPPARTDAGHHAYGPARTEALLAAAMAHTHAAAGCIVDAQGLVIAHHGVSAEVAQSLGGRLLLALDQVARLGNSELLVVTSAVKGQWVSGVRLREAEAMAIGLVGPLPLGPEHQQPLLALLTGVSVPPTPLP